MQLPHTVDVLDSDRIKALQLLSKALNGDFAQCRKIECSAHELSTNTVHYFDIIVRCIVNIHNNPNNALPDMVYRDDDDLTGETILERIRNTERERQVRFKEMLQEKYNDINATEGYDSSLKCRRCNSNDISWDQKQTRGADESMTTFCSCSTCGNRWTMR